MTPATRAVLNALLNIDDEDRETYLWALCSGTGLGSGSVSPILGRLHDLGWIADRWERPEDRSHAPGRPPRRYWRVTELGRIEGRHAVAESGGESGVPVKVWFDKVTLELIDAYATDKKVSREEAIDRLVGVGLTENLAGW